jgi:hypothetical protein
MNFYVHEKLRELEAEQLEKRHRADPPASRRPLFGALAAVTGRTLRRAGEGLESWAAPAAQEPDSRIAGPAAR